jgi:DNA processing protein
VRRLTEAVSARRSDDPAERPSIGHALIERVVAAAREREAFLARVGSLGLTALSLDDPAYPARLRAIEMPPPVLYVRGDVRALQCPRAVAVVGTRRPSDAGRRTASRIAGALARSGASVVSGLAVGIDGAAHAAALAEGGPTVAVLGGGHGRIYPRAHVRLAEAIASEGGAVVGELPPDVAPARGSFPRRNRLISGLADATVVVEAAARSGALITAGWALEQGRSCYVVPGAIDAPMSAGCLAFLREWPGEARIVAGVGELIEDLGLSAPPVVHAAGDGLGRRPVLAELGPAERAVAAALVDGRASVDDIVAETSLPVAAVLGTLTLLEMRGLAAGAYGRYIAVGRLATLPAARRGSRPGRR